MREFERNCPVPPANPQEARLINRKKRTEKSKVKSVKKRAEDDGQAGKRMPKTVENSPTVLTKEIQEIKAEIQGANVLSKLSKECTDEEESMSTAREVRVHKPTEAPAEPVKKRLMKLHDINMCLKELKSYYAKRQDEVDLWHIKYEKRIIDMQLDMGNFEKKITHKINKEIVKVDQLEHLAELNTAKRKKAEKKLQKIAPSGRDPTFLTNLVQTAINILQLVLYYIAVIRDLMFYTQVLPKTTRKTRQ